MLRDQRTSGPVSLTGDASLPGGFRAALPTLEVLPASGMERWIQELWNMPRGFKEYYLAQWMRNFIIPCMRAPDSINVIVREGETLLAYATAGPLEKYCADHPCAGIGRTLMISGIETAPGLAAFTTNPRLWHIYSSTECLHLFHSACFPDKKPRYSFLISDVEPSNYESLVRKLDLRPKKRMTIGIETEMLRELRLLKGAELIRRAREMQDSRVLQGK